jgi:hypothetical protein
MNSLCDDVLYCILKWFRCLKDINNVQSISRKFNLLVRADHLWRHYYYETYSACDVLSGASYRISYMTCYKVSLLISKLNINESICSVLKFSDLDLWSKNIKIVPREIGQLTNLRGLDLEDNEIVSLPAEIGQLTNLQQLCLNSNLGELSPNFQFGVTRSRQYPQK